MAVLDTIDKIAHQGMLHTALPGIPLWRLWTTNAFARLADLAEWSWRTRYSQLVAPAAYSTGTVSVTSADPTLITGVGTTFTQAMTGRQFRIGSSFGYDILTIIDSTHLRLSLPWADADQSNVGYSIYQQFFSVPDDFSSFVSVLDPTRNYRIRHGVERREVDKRDPRRTITGIPYVIAEAGYASTPGGSVDLTPVTAVGSGPAPTFSGIYLGPADALYIVEITLGGASGTATFKWKKDGGSYVTGVLTDSEGVGLSDGVVVAFPTATYVLGDVFVARAKAVLSQGGPRYEMWPTQLSLTVYPYYYVTLPPDLSTPGATLPHGIRGDVVLKGAIAECADWPGRDGVKNPYYDPRDAQKMRIEFERMVDILALRDDETYPKQVTYWQDLPFAGPPWDSSWEQRHN